MSIPIKRACDACHRRKVRCNSRQPCGNCSQAGLSCTYDAVPQKKGPKGSRAKVISELRETQKQSDLAQYHQQQQQQLNGSRIYSSPPDSPSYTPTPGLLNYELIDACADVFFIHLYPTMPVLDREQLQHIANDISSSPEAYCLCSALCAFILIQPGVPTPTNTGHEMITNPRMGQALMDEAMRVRKGLDFIESPTLESIITSFFLYGCGFGLNKHNTAWNHLREATGQAHSLGMQDEQTYLFGDVRINSQRRRLFWLLFATERAYALQKHLPLTLHATISLPPETANPSLTGFLHLLTLYRPIDDTFINLWNKSRTDCSALWLSSLQQQLTRALPFHLTNTTEAQAADLRCSQQWLRNVVWQLSIANGCLSSASQDSSMTFRYPIEIARELVAVMMGFSKQAMEVHGVGLIEKLFDIACTLIDVLSCVPPAPFSTAPIPQPQPLQQIYSQQVHPSQQMQSHPHSLHHPQQHRPQPPQQQMHPQHPPQMPHQQHPGQQPPSPISSTTTTPTAAVADNDPRTHLTHLLTLISTLRGGESRYLPLALAKIRDALPGVAESLTGPGGSMGGSMGGVRIKQESGGSNSSGGGPTLGGGPTPIGVSSGPPGPPIPGSASTSGASSPFGDQAFLHYYPLA